MPGMVRPIIDERDGLLRFLAQQRDALRYAVHGLTDEQAAARPSASALSLAGLVKHAAHVERFWIQLALTRPESIELGSAQDWENEFRMVPGESLAGLVEMYAEVAAETELIVAGMIDLGQAVPVPQGVPWFPADVEAWSVRWVLLHLIEETGRHAGHADLIRESLDGATALRLMAAAEGWPDTPWASS